MKRFNSARAFESGAHLAWLVDRNWGYRSAPRWHLARLDSCNGGCVQRFIRPAEGTPLPPIETFRELRLAPSHDGRVFVTSPARMFVQHWGDEHVVEASGEIEVSFGSVLRFGPLLLAPLSAEQVEAIRCGHLALPIINGEMTVLSSDRQEPDDGARLRFFRRLGRIYAASFIVLSLVAVTVPVLLGLGDFQLSTVSTGACDQRIMNQLACVILSVTATWSLLGALGLLVRRKLDRWAYRAE